MYEYRILEIRGKKQAEQIMNQFSQEGWRVVSNAHYYSFGNVFFITLERKIN